MSNIGGSGPVRSTPDTGLGAHAQLSGTAQALMALYESMVADGQILKQLVEEQKELRDRRSSMPAPPRHIQKDGKAVDNPAFGKWVDKQNELTKAIESLEGKWKLSQNQPQPRRVSIIAGLARQADANAQASAQWMMDVGSS